MGKPPRLVEALAAEGSHAFLADTAPIIYRLERGAPPAFVTACDPLFEAVERGDLGCVISAITVAELLIKPARRGPAAVATVDAFLRQPMLGIADVDAAISRRAAFLVADDVLTRLADSLIAATALELGLPIVTGDRHLSRSGAVKAFLVAEYVESSR